MSMTKRYLESLPQEDQDAVLGVPGPEMHAFYTFSARLDLIEGHFAGQSIDVRADSYNELIDAIIGIRLPMSDVACVYAEMADECGNRLQVITEVKLRSAVSARLSAREQGATVAESARTDWCNGCDGGCWMCADC